MRYLFNAANSGIKYFMQYNNLYKFNLGNGTKYCEYLKLSDRL